MFDKIKGAMGKTIKKVKIKELSDKDLDPILADLEKELMRNDVASTTADALITQLKSELLNLEHARFHSARPMIEEAMRLSLKKILVHLDNIDLLEQVAKAKEKGDPYIIVMLGINGTGKTTTIAKLTHLLKQNGYSVVIAAADTYRAGAVDQLGKHAENLSVKMISHQLSADSKGKADPTAVAVDAIDHAFSKGVDVVIIDTAGRMNNNINLVKELDKIIRNSDPDLKIFVGDSLAGNDVVRQAMQFDDEIGIDGVIMTKIDSDAKGGSVLSVAHSISRPILYLGVGQSYDDLVPFDPEYILQQIMP